MGKGKWPLCYLFLFPLPIEQRGLFFPSSQLPYATQKAPAEKTKLGLEQQVIEAGQILSFDNRGRLGNTKKQKNVHDQQGRHKSPLQFFHGIHSERAVGVEKAKKRLRQIPIKESEIYLLVVI